MPAEERKLATVLFADLVGSAALADDEEIARAGGTVEKADLSTT